MRGSAIRQLSMLSATTPDELVPAVHPIRRIRPMVELARSWSGRRRGRSHLDRGTSTVFWVDPVGLDLQFHED